MSLTYTSDDGTPLIIYESDVSKTETTDPIWILTSLIRKSDLEPNFKVNIYQSIDYQKTKRALVGSVVIELEHVIGP